ncbi:hypothetical protein RJ55_06560 [Drechmeria coniospora]|nr:hypothetical protein RJ55_06560 [Drechmeria coniospora]
MPSPKPVPSRATLNALRGVVLTTSCSVIVLAEERRRRLQMARAAIDNARKLHTVRSNRGPIALADGLATWEANLADVGDGVMSMPSLPRPRTSTRRRRHGAQTNASPPDVETSKNARDLPNAPARQSVSAMPTNSELHSLLSDMVNLKSLFQFDQSHPETRHHNAGWKTSARFTKSEPVALAKSSPTDFGIAARPSDPKAHPSNVLESVTNHDTAQVPDALETARSYLARSVQGASTSPPRPFHNDALAALEGLVYHLETHLVDGAKVSEGVDMATAIFQRLTSFGSSIPDVGGPIRSTALHLLRLTLEADASKATVLLDAILPMCKDPSKIVVPFLRFMQESEASECIMEQLLDLLSDRHRAPFWRHGMLVHRMLRRHSSSYGSFQDTKKLYKVMQTAGLFQHFGISHASQYNIRRMMVAAAADQGDDVFIDLEMAAIRQLEPDASRFDMKLQSKLVVRDAVLGKWNSVHDQIRRLMTVVDVACVEFQRMVTRVTDAFAQAHAPDELENFLRTFMREYGIKPRPRWVYLVLDGHAARHQVDAVFSWLQVCSDGGLSMDEAFIQRFYGRCRKFWSFSDKSIAKLQMALPSLVPATSRPGPNNVDSCGGSNSTSTRQRRRRHGEGSAVDESHEKGPTPSDVGLRLAVVEQLRSNDGPQIDRAIALVCAADKGGIDVSAALTPLLLARLERREEPRRLIDDALRMGVEIHDSVYNKASQALSARGDLAAAVDMCTLAARENGDGRLSYNEFNFANLVFAYTGSGRYRPLRSLLCDFTSEERWWHGSRTCKESIKLAMKTAAMRTVVRTRDKASHRQALDQLDAALVHVKRCRSNNEHRRAVAEGFLQIMRAPSTAELRSDAARGEDNGNKRQHVDGRSSERLVVPPEPAGSLIMVAEG